MHKILVLMVMIGLVGCASSSTSSKQTVNDVRGPDDVGTQHDVPRADFSKKEDARLSDSTDVPDGDNDPPDDLLPPDLSTDIADGSELSVSPSATATDTALSTNFSVTITGKGNSFVTAASITNNVGSVAIDGTTYAAFVHELQPWAGFNYDLFQTVVVGNDRIYVLWFYCRAGALKFIYYEGTDGTKIAYVAASGTCAIDRTASKSSVKLPAVTLENLVLIDNYTVTGALSIDDSQRSFALAGQTYSVYPFSEVDCSTECGDDPWYELHVILQPVDRKKLCFGIFYFFGKRPTSIRFTYGICLPDLSDPFGSTSFSGSWTRN